MRSTYTEEADMGHFGALVQIGCCRYPQLRLRARYVLVWEERLVCQRISTVLLAQSSQITMNPYGA